MREIEDLMSVEEVAKKLGLAKSTVYAMTHRKLIPCIKIGKSTRIRPESLARFLNEREKASYGDAA